VDIPVHYMTKCQHYRDERFYYYGGVGLDVWLVGWRIICRHDRWTESWFGDGCYILGSTDSSTTTEVEETIGSSEQPEATSSSTSSEYWDRLVAQCIRTASELVESGMLSSTNIANIEPSAIQSILGVAIWTILSESVMSERVDTVHDIFWSIGGTLCRVNDRPKDDRIMTFLWPMVMTIRSALESNKQYMVEQSASSKVPSTETIRTSAVVALLCSSSISVAAPLAGQGQEIRPPPTEASLFHKQVRNQVTALVLAVLRVRPYQERMGRIFEHAYGFDPEQGRPLETAEA